MGVFAKFASVGSASMASRVLGFVREALIAGLMGAGPVADAFYAAFRFPNLFRRILAEGAFNIAFIPLFASELELDGKTGSQTLCRRSAFPITTRTIGFVGNCHDFHAISGGNGHCTKICQ